MMGEIYSKTHEIFVYLSKASKLEAEFLRRVHVVGRLGKLIKDKRKYIEDIKRIEKAVEGVEEISKG
jgi:hypothetical protein